MRKIFIVVSVLVGISISSNFVYADYNCDKKLHALERQLKYAKQYGNYHRISGLKRAIARVQEHCDGRYRHDYSDLDQHHDDINHYQSDQKLRILEDLVDAKKDLAKAEYKLEKAKRKNDIEDVYEAQYKIREARGRIDLYERSLQEFK